MSSRLLFPTLLPLTALVVVPLLGAPAAVAAELPLRCAAPQPGRYAVMGEGDSRGEPVARLL